MPSSNQGRPRQLPPGWNSVAHLAHVGAQGAQDRARIARLERELRDGVLRAAMQRIYFNRFVNRRASDRRYLGGARGPRYPATVRARLRGVFRRVAARRSRRR